MHNELVDHWALLRAERADARSVNNRCGFRLRASDVGRALRYAWGSAPARRPTRRSIQLVQFSVSPPVQFRMSLESLSCLKPAMPC